MFMVRLLFSKPLLLGYEIDKCCSLASKVLLLRSLGEYILNVMTLTHIKCSCFATVLKHDSLCDTE
jgi:hypothetical protein